MTFSSSKVLYCEKVRDRCYESREMIDWFIMCTHCGVAMEYDLFDEPVSCTKCSFQPGEAPLSQHSFDHSSMPRLRDYPGRGSGPSALLLVQWLCLLRVQRHRSGRRDMMWKHRVRGAEIKSKYGQMAWAKHVCQRGGDAHEAEGTRGVRGVECFPERRVRDRWSTGKSVSRGRRWGKT